MKRAAAHWSGLSPRVRGKRYPPPSHRPDSGSIPACAGEAGGDSSGLYAWGVYPRVCGGSPRCGLSLTTARGLSPRVRGKRELEWRWVVVSWSIPACAGEARCGGGGGHAGGVYPRVCGGSDPQFHQPLIGVGLSPRVRGKHPGPRTPRAAGRSIPACAGEAGPGQPCNPSQAVYPRVCGGSDDAPVWTDLQSGLSPRVRGKLVGLLGGGGQVGSIPACAGEASLAAVVGRRLGVYPRVCGGSRPDGRQRRPHQGLSPRVRGKRIAVKLSHPRPRSIPACAGEAPLANAAADAP